MRNACKGSIALILLALLAACTASSRIVRTYEGEALAANRVARIEVPEDIQMVSINGIAQKDYLLDNLALTYEVTPGTHVLVYQYSGLWSVPGGGEDKPRAEVVESAERELTFEFKAGETYRITHEPPLSRNEAKEYASNGFQATLVGASGAVLQRDSLHAGFVAEPAPMQVTPSALPAPAVAANAAPAVSATPSAAAPVGGGAAVVGVPAVQSGGQAQQSGQGDISRLDALKVLWQQTSPEDKKEFLRWAFE